MTREDIFEKYKDDPKFHTMDENVREAWIRYKIFTEGKDQKDIHPFVYFGKNVHFKTKEEEEILDEQIRQAKERNKQRQRLFEIEWKFELPDDYKYLGFIDQTDAYGTTGKVFVYDFVEHGKKNDFEIRLNIYPVYTPDTLGSGLVSDIYISFDDTDAVEPDVSNNQNVPFSVMKHIGGLLKKFIYEDLPKQLTDIKGFEWEYISIQSFQFESAKENGDDGRRRMLLYKDVYAKLAKYLKLNASVIEDDNMFIINPTPSLIVYENGVVSQEDLYEVNWLDEEDTTGSTESYLGTYLKESKMR